MPNNISIRPVAFIFVLLALAVGGLFLWRQPAPQATAQASLLPLLSESDTAGFARATEPNAIEFPRDLGPHPEYQTEWWYYTGNLEGENGRLFGYQFTIFRRALTAEIGDWRLETENQSPQSDWRTNQVYLAHFTLADVANSAFYPHERFSRGAAGLAGAQAEPYRVWLEDWSIEEIAPGEVVLKANGDDVAINLTLTQTMPPVLHGDRGLSPKGAEPGNASYYYSIIRQATAGTVRVGEESFAVTGLSWKDHEYSTSALSAEAVGWDWFSLQLDNGGGLMLFQIRNADGSLEPFSSGSYIAPDGTITHLELADFDVAVLDTWVSPTSGGEYPAAWRIRVPKLELELEGRPLMPNQELNVSTIYWEGAVEFSGALAGQPVTARGYVELTGYGESMNGRI
jgi:predicted secreted hydrolase